MNILLKLKEKIRRILGKIVSPKTAFGIVLVVLVFTNVALGSLVFPKKALAVNTYSPDQIIFTMDPVIGGKADNLLRVVSGQGASFTVQLTLSSPSTGLLVDPPPNNKGDIVDFTRLGFEYAKSPIQKVSLGIESRYNNTCTDNRRDTFGKEYVSCTFAINKPVVTAGTMQAGRTYTATFNLTSAQVNALMQGTPQGQVSYFSVQPYLDIEIAWGSDNNFAFVGKDIYVKSFPNLTALQADVASNNRTGVPNYGSLTAGSTTAGPDPLTKFLNSLVTAITGFIIDTVYKLFAFLIAPMLQGLLSIRVYTDQFVNVIYPGWEVLRNVANIYFIIAIIAIAMGTLFRVESYKARHLLVQLIIAALTVNFSLVIGQAILGVADTIQSQFLPNSTQVINQLALDLMPNNIKDILNAQELAAGSFFATAITNTFFMAMAVGSFLVFCAIVVFLVIRIVALWLLLMVSPLAYAAGVLPSTSSLRGKWWGEFLKYAFFTPIMAFFLNMAAIIAVNYEFVFRDINDNIAATAEWKNFATLVFAVASNILLLFFLIAALQISKQFGIYGSEKIMDIAKRGMLAPFKLAAAPVVGGAKGAGFLAKRGGGYVARRYNEWTSGLVTDKHGTKANLKKAAFAVLNPVNFFRGWEERSKEKKEWAHEIAKGAGQMAASELLTGGKERVNYKQLALQKIQRGIASKLRESLGDDPGRAESMDLQRRINEVDGFEGQILRGAAALLTGNQGWGDDTNEVASDTKSDREYWGAELRKRGTEKAGMELFKQACKTYDDQGFETMQWVYQGLDLNILAKLRNDIDGKMYERDEHHPTEFKNKDFQTFIEKNQLQLMNIAALTDGAKKVGHYEQMFMAKKDDKSGFYMPLVDSNWSRENFENDPENFNLNKAPRSNEIIAEVNKIGIRPFWQNTAWHNLIRKVKRVSIKNERGETIGERDAEWNEDGEWGVGKWNHGGTLLQQYLRKKTISKKYASQSVHAQARIIEYVIGKNFDKNGRFKNIEAKEDFKQAYRENKDLTSIMTFMHLTGNPPREDTNLYKLLSDPKHGGHSPRELAELGINPNDQLSRGDEEAEDGT